MKALRLTRALRPVALGALLGLSVLASRGELVSLHVGLSGGAANASLRITFLGAEVARADNANPEVTTAIEVPLEEPVLLQVVGEGVGDYRLTLTPPAHLTSLIGGIRQGAYISTQATPRPVNHLLPVTLVRREPAATALPLGQAESIAWYPPKSLGAKAPYLDFHVGAALNGEALPPLRIPLQPRSVESDPLPFDFPDSLYTPAAGGFELITPQVVARLALDPQAPGSFHVSFHVDPASPPFARYHFQFPVWPVSWRESRQVRVLNDGMIAGTGRTYETSLTGYFTSEGMGQIAPYNTWLLADWRLTGEAPLRVVDGSRAVVSSGGAETESGAWFPSGELRDTITVKNDSTGVAERHRHTYQSFDRWSGDPTVPGQTVFVLAYHVAGTGLTTYQAVNHQDPRAPSIHGTHSSGGLVRISDSDASQQKTYTSWRDHQPSFTPTNPLGAQVAANRGLVTTTSYASATPLYAYRLPASVISEVEGVRIGRTEVTYTLEGDIIRARRDAHASSAPGDLVQSEASWYRPDASVAALRSRPVSVRQAGGAQWSFAYRLTGDELVVATLAGTDADGNPVSALPDFGPITALHLIPRRSTLTVETFRRGRLVRRETRVYLDGEGASPVFNPGPPVAWETFEYTPDGRLRSRTAGDNTRYEAEWSGARLLWERDETGLRTVFRHDAMDRVVAAETEAALGQPAQATTFAYDAAHRIRFRRIGASDAAGLPVGEQLVTEYRYDDGGRIAERTDPGGATDGTAAAPGITTRFEYASGDRDVTETRGDATLVTRRFNDGRVRDITGTAAVPPRAFDYTVESSGRIRHTVTAAGQRTASSSHDWLGRIAEQRRNGVIQADGQSRPMITSYRYNARGLLERVAEVEGQGAAAVPWGAARIYAYDAFGALKATGLDLNGTAGLQAESTDRMETFETRFHQDTSQAWWLHSSTHTHHTNGSAAVHTQQAFRRLTQFSASQTAQIDHLDFHNNRSSELVTFDPVAKTRHHTVQAADSTRRVTVTAGALTLSAQRVSDAGVAELPALFAYDSLGRLRQHTSPRGVVTRHEYHVGTAQRWRSFAGTNQAGQEIVAAQWTYDAQGRIASVTDAQGRETTHTYYPTGLPNERGGSASHPLQHVYDAFGQLIELRTFRQGTAGTPDRTTWTYDPHTGWPTGRRDAAQRETRLTYATASPHHVVTRISPRAGLTTVYRHRLDTGELASVDYSDATPDLTYTYTRTGQIDTVSDATGIRDYLYDRERLAAEHLGSWYGNLVLTSLPDDTTTQNPGANRVPGRHAGYALGYVSLVQGTPQTQEMDRELKVAWGYDDFGRPGSLTVSHAGQTAATFSYAYTPNSNFWHTRTSGALQQERTPEPNRDLVQRVSTRWLSTTLVQHDYRYFDTGEVRETHQRGSLFADHGPDQGALVHAYAYHGSGALHTATAYAGVVGGPVLPGRNHSYTYDTAGNRRTVGVGAATASYTDEANSLGANRLNQVRARTTLPGRIQGTAHPDATISAPGASVSRVQGQRYWDAVLEGWGRYADFSVSALRNGVQQATIATRLIRPDRETLDYDEAGNLIADSLWTYQYDAENRLVRMATRSRAELPGLRWQTFPPERELRFRYDHLGRRVEKIALKDNVVTYSRRYVYAGWNLIAEFELTNGAPVMRRTYAWGLDISGSTTATGGLGGLVLQTLHQGASRSHYHVASDGHGNVVALLDGNGAAAAAYEYDPFGQLQRDDGARSSESLGSGDLPGDNPFRFSSKYWDRETGLYDYGHRFYDPSLGRFLNRDPIGEAGGANLYAFAGNDPINGWDYLGLEGAPKKFEPLDFVSGKTADMPAEDGSFARRRETNEGGKEIIRTPFGTDAINSAADIARYGEIRAVPDRMGPPIPLTVKNVAAVFIDAMAKAIVGATTIGNHVDPPRGNLQEIGTGFGIARTALGDTAGVDVNNPRFGVASDIALIAFSITGMPRGGQANLQGRTVTVFRVEGVPNARIFVDGTGRVVIAEGNTLWVNIGQETRAWHYLNQKIMGGLPGAQIKSFVVPRSFLDEIRAIAVSEEKASNFPDRPVIGDPTKAPDQYGLRPAQVDGLRRAIIQGTGKTTGR